MRRSAIAGAGRRAGIVVTMVLALLASGCGARFPDEQGSTASTVVNADGTTDTVAGSDAGAPVDPNAPAGPTSDPGTPGAPTPTPGSPGASGGGPGTTRPGSPSTTLAASAPGAVEPGPAPGVTATEIKVGYLLPLTGAAPVPSNFDKGANVYWNDINAKGGINGRKVKVIIRDTQSSASVGKQEAQKLVEDEKVFMVVVLDRLENQQAIGAYLDGRKVPNLEIQTPANLAKNQTWTFGVTIDHAVQGRLVAQYLATVMKATKLAIVYENTPALLPGKDAYVKGADGSSAKVVYTKAIDGQENDFSGVALDLANSGATAVWLYMAPTPAAKLANQADAAGYHPTWFANSISWNFDLVFKVAPKALAGARAFSPWVPLSDARTNTYQAAYRQQTGETPDDLGIVGWGVGEIAGEALRRAGKTLGQNNFRDAMQHLNFKPQVWAPLAFGNDVRQGANKIAVLKESGGQWVLERDFTGSF